MTSSKAQRKRTARLRTPTPFVAIDGEAFDVRLSDDKDYALITAWGPNEEAGARTLYTPNGSLHTLEIFDFLRDVKRQAPPKCRFVGFYFTYDANYILKDCPHDILVQLWKTHDVRVSFTRGESETRHFRVEWIPTKWLLITEYQLKPITYHDGSVQQFWTTVWSIRIEDASGFFQSSFVKALQQWHVATDDELHFIDDMKQRRSSFSRKDRRIIQRYNEMECRLLVRLMQRLDTMLRTHDIKLGYWHGPGAIALALMQQHNVLHHHADIPPQLSDAVHRAYFGGRTQILRMGLFERVYTYDVNSAYPSACVELPTLKGQWLKLTTFDPAQRWSVWHVKWDFNHNKYTNVKTALRVTPFPFRLRNGNIIYPLDGEGWYWYPEVAEALKDFPHDISILEGYALQPYNPTVKPFAYLHDIYAQRQQLKAAGDDSERVYKLGLNSTYGKIVQGYNSDGALPRQHSLVWGGLITSMTRAKLYRAAMQQPDAIIQFATDAIWTTEPLNLPLSNSMGDWDLSTGEDFFILKPGVSHMRVSSKTHSTHTRTRGLTPDSMTEETWNKVRAQWLKDHVTMTYDVMVTRFYGLGKAIANSNWSDWLHWTTTPVHISVQPRRGEAYPEDASRHRYKILPKLLRTFAPDLPPDSMSTPYVLKHAPHPLNPELLDEIISRHEQPDYE